MERFDVRRRHLLALVGTALARRLRCRTGVSLATTFGGKGLRVHIEPAFLFDLDGTLVDSVYQHVLSWKEVLDAQGIKSPSGASIARSG
jgi:hypothetical protein